MIFYSVKFKITKITFSNYDNIIFPFIDTDDSKLESCSYMVKGVHLLLGEPSDFGFSFAMDIFHKVNSMCSYLNLIICVM